jgi:hypothetical protein
MIQSLKALKAVGKYFTISHGKKGEGPKKCRKSISYYLNGGDFEIHCST